MKATGFALLRLAAGVSACFACGLTPALASDKEDTSRSAVGPTGGTPVVASKLPKIRVTRDGKGFAGSDGKPFVPFGVNYFRPHTGWAPQVWKQFDPEAVRKDFALLKAYGVNCVRVFLSYGSFYDTPGVLSEDGIRKFDQFLRLADEAGIYVHPTGPDHWEGTPEWARRDTIADEDVLRALERFWKLFASRYKGVNTIFAYDLRNEPSVPWNSPAVRKRWTEWVHRRYSSQEDAAKAWGVPPESVTWDDIPVPAPEDKAGDRMLLDYQRCREEIADEWTRRQAAAIKAADPDALVTVGLIQWSVPAVLPGVQHYSAFRPDRQARFVDFLEIHFYPLARGMYEYRSLEERDLNLAYLESVVSETARAGKPAVIAEYGWYGGGALKFESGNSRPAREEEQAEWCSRLIETTQGLAVGWLNWGVYDHPEARDVTQLTGLFTVDGKEKVWGRRFREIARQIAQSDMKAKGLKQRPKLDWELCVTSRKAAEEFLEAYHRAYVESKESAGR
ncbi:MAG: cellulase family glycosylhydrolase [Armatimonadota bacterium]